MKHYNQESCHARRWNEGFIGEHNGEQCKNSIYKNYFCEFHYKKWLECKEYGCLRGIRGLGACNHKTTHRGLQFGTIDQPIPMYDDMGQVQIKWKDRELKYNKEFLRKKNKYLNTPSKQMKQSKKYKIIRKNPQKKKSRFIINRIKQPEKLKVKIKKYSDEELKPQNHPSRW